MISAVYAAAGGALLATPTGNVDPTLAYWTHSGNIVFMVLLGASSSFFGPLLGAFAFIFLQDTVMSVFPYWRLIFGAILAFIVIFAPGGLMGLFTAAGPSRFRARDDPRGPGHSQALRRLRGARRREPVHPRG